jgi:chaperone BCS1
MISLESLYDLAKAQPILTGGVGTVMFGSAMYFVKGVPLWIHSFVKRMITINVTLNSDSHLYHEILGVLSAGRVGAFARNYTTDGRGDIVAGFGRSVAVVERRLVTFNRHIIPDKFKMTESLEITVFSRNVDVLRRIVEKAKTPKNDNTVKVYTGTSYWQHPVRKRRRSLDTVFVNGDIKNRIIKKVEWFLANEDWYLQRGIPYKLVFLLHGEPGTGKSSLVYGIASFFKKNLGSATRISSIDELLRHLPDDTLAVVEDIDMLTVNRDPEDDDVDPESAPAAATDNDPAATELSALHVLINTLDGLSTPHGLILFITTNFRERLDVALIRPGRVDEDMLIGPLDRETTAQMFAAFYGEQNVQLILPYLSSPGFQPKTGAQLQLAFMASDPVEAINNLKEAA